MGSWSPLQAPWENPKTHYWAQGRSSPRSLSWPRRRRCLGFAQPAGGPCPSPVDRGHLCLESGPLSGLRCPGSGLPSALSLWKGPACRRKEPSSSHPALDPLPPLRACGSWIGDYLRDAYPPLDCGVQCPRQPQGFLSVLGFAPRAAPFCLSSFPCSLLFVPFEALVSFRPHRPSRPSLWSASFSPRQTAEILRKPTVPELNCFGLFPSRSHRPRRGDFPELSGGVMEAIWGHVQAKSLSSLTSAFRSS